MRKFSIACAAFAIANAWLAPLAAAADPATTPRSGRWKRASPLPSTPRTSRRSCGSIRPTSSCSMSFRPASTSAPRPIASARPHGRLRRTGQVDISDLAVSSDGAIGYSHSIQHVRSSDSQGHDMDMTVRVTDVYRKQDGRWRIVQEHVSAPIDLATGKGDLTRSPRWRSSGEPPEGLLSHPRDADARQRLRQRGCSAAVICSATRAPSSCAARTRAMNSARAFSDG